MSRNASARISRALQPGATPLVTPEGGESPSQGTSEGLRPAGEVTRDAVAGRSKFVSFASLLERRPLARVALALLWLALVLGGLVCVKKFMAELESEVPPCKGTPSYDAQTMFDKFFPAQPTNGVFLVKTAGGAPLLQFANTSTCRIAVHPRMDTQNKTVHIPLTCDDITGTALGGGCLTKQDLEADFDGLVVNITNAVLLNIGVPDATVKQIQAWIESKLHKLFEPLPNISTCPVRSVGNITSDFLKFTKDLNSTLATDLQEYRVQMQTIESIPAQTLTLEDIHVPLIGWDVNVSVTVPPGEFWELFQKQFFADALSTTLVAAQISNPDGQKINEMGTSAKAIGKTLEEARAAVIPSALAVQVSSMGLMIDSVQTGIDSTMNQSTLTVPVALLILAGMVRNLRLLVVTLVNLLACIASTILIMYPIASRMTTSTTAPALMVALALAMSIDYSLFLLTRFNDEVDNGVRPADAVAIALNTSGRIVLVSGVTLLLCFLMMLVLPVVFISSMGVCATVTVSMAVLAALTLTPVTLLSFPSFFSSNKCWGLSSQGCCCCCCCPGRDSSSSSDARTVDARNMDLSKCKRSIWPRFGKQIQRFAWVVVVLLLAIVVPVGIYSIPHLSYSVGLLPMMPRDTVSTNTVLDLQDSFGVGTIFPNQVIAIPPEGATATEAGRASWLAASCAVLQAVADEVNVDPKLPPFTSGAFMGPMIMAGRCSSDTGPSASWSSVGSPYSAAKVMIQYELDPFSTEGQAWIIRLREAFAKTSATEVASWYILGAGPIQMDVANKTFKHLPLMVSLMMVVVFIVIGVAFRSVVAPLRAVFCLLWMLVITFGCAIFVFQDGALSFLHWAPLGQRDTGAMSWMSPCMAFSMVVGLGLDYDIFYSERVAEEWNHGYDEKTAAVRALAATANTISAAGIIMVMAFGALLVSATPALNEISFLLILGVLLDCFVTTKVIIPCAMSLLGRANFWPRKQDQTAAAGTLTEGPQATVEDVQEPREHHSFHSAS